jgi:2-oxoglutarate ferredoxin oxidoreductase subunit delta
MESVAAKPRAQKFRGEVFINTDRCKGCGFCIEFCPPKVLVSSEKYNSHGYHPPVLVNETRCTGCDLCGLYCPDFAIYGIRVPMKEGAAQPAVPAG